MSNLLHLNELVSSMQPPLNPPSCLSQVMMNDPVTSSLQQTTASKKSEYLSYGYFQNFPDSKRCDFTPQQTLITLPDKQSLNTESGLNSNAQYSRHVSPIQYAASEDRPCVFDAGSKYDRTTFIYPAGPVFNSKDANPSLHLPLKQHSKYERISNSYVVETIKISESNNGESKKVSDSKDGEPKTISDSEIGQPKNISNSIDGESKKISDSKDEESEIISDCNDGESEMISNSNDGESKMLSNSNLESKKNSDSNDGDSLSNLPQNQTSESLEVSESESNNFVLKLDHFDEILEFCSKVYLPCKCDVCGMSYRNFQELLDHYDSHRVYPCDLCSKSFKKQYYLNVHIKRKHPKNLNMKKSFKIPLIKQIPKMIFVKRDETVSNKTFKFDIKKLFSCDTCGKFYKSERVLDKHKCQSYVCKLCNKVYRHYSSLENHKRYNHGNKRYICDICGKSLISPVNLRIHMQCHDEGREKNFKCDVCDRAFVRKVLLEKHKIVHSDDRPHLCHLCPKSFKSSSYLTEHIRTHSDDRPYKCIVCGSGFVSKGKLKRHGYIHSDIKPHNCLTCGKGFSQRALLVRHFKIHPEPTWSEFNEFGYS